MKKIILSLSFLLGICLSLQAQSADERALECFNNYLDLFLKKPQKASEQLKQAASYAKTASELDIKMRMFIWYFYLGDLIKNDPTNSSELTSYSDCLVSYGTRNKELESSYGMQLMIANAEIIYAGYAKAMWKPVYLGKALWRLRAIKDNKLQPVAEPDFTSFYQLSALEVSDAERLKMETYATQMASSITAEQWYDAACTAYDNLKMEGHAEASIMAMFIAKQGGCANAWWLHGLMLEDGKIIQRDLNAAFDCYKKAAEGGSVRGKMDYARFLVGGKVCKSDYALALQLLTSVQADEEFAVQGGAYTLARMYENGWGVEIDEAKAQALYMETYEKSINLTIQKKAYEGSNRIDDRTAERQIDAEVKQMNVEQLTTTELNALAQRYEAVKAVQKSFIYRMKAVEKGNSYSACRMGLLYFDNKGRHKDEASMAMAAKMFAVGAKGNYAPNKYNLAVMYLYGYGLSPDHDKARLYFQQYLDQIAAEGSEEYSKDDYLSVISGMLYSEDSTKRGVPLRVELGQFEKASQLYQWAVYRERDTKPEVSIYFYERAIAKGHKQAVERLARFKKRLAQEQNK